MMGPGNYRFGDFFRLGWGLLLVVFLAATSLVKLLSVSLGARLAGFGGLDVVNLAMATNARGGPGIVLASVAFDSGIVNASAKIVARHEASSRGADL